MQSSQRFSSRRTLAALTVALAALGACGDDDDGVVGADGADGDPAAATLAPAAVPDAGKQGESDRPRATTIDDSAVASEPADRPGDRTIDGTIDVDIAPDATWQWQLQGEIDTAYDVDVYDIDLFDAPTATIEQLHADGRLVVCYYSAGSYEEWRDDAGEYPAAAIGEPLDGWPGERWVDTRSDAVRTIIDARHDLAAAKGCDGVEPDNVTAFQNDSGFDLSADDQLDFNRFLARSAHARGLLIGLKNDLDQIPQLVDEFDFAVNEECLDYDECDVYAPFVDAGKAVFNAEYSDAAVDDPAATCAVAAEFGLRTLILSLDLDDSFRIDCADLDAPGS